MAACSVRAVGIFRRNSFILLHRLKGDAFWSLPGGRVEVAGGKGADGRTDTVRLSSQV